MSNSAYREDVCNEFINGRIVAMSPRPIPNHTRVAFNITRIFDNYLKGKPCIVYSDGVDVFLTRKDRFVPDVMVVCNRDIIKKDGIHGAPDLIVEVLSPTTEKRDRQYKRLVYAQYGVKEYWLVNVNSRSIEIYTQADGQAEGETGRLELFDVFTDVPDFEIARMEEDEKANVIYEFSPFLFPDLVIPIEDVFYNVIDF